jgi:alpha-glucosidase
MQKLTEYTSQSPGDTLYVHFYSGSVDNQFVYYEDDGITFNYSDGAYYKRVISFEAASKTIKFLKKEGSLTSKFSVLTIVLHGFTPQELKKLTINGAAQKVQEDKMRFFASNFKFADYGPDDTKKVLNVSFKNSDDGISVSW